MKKYDTYKDSGIEWVGFFKWKMKNGEWKMKNGE